MTAKHIALALFVCLIWGFNFTASKYAVGYFPTFFLLSVRLLLVSVILLPFIKKPQMPFIKLFSIATMLTVVHFGCMFAALENGLNSSVAAVVDQTRVPIAVLMGYLFLNESIDKKIILGIAIAIAGTLTIIGTPNIVHNYPAFFMLLGSSLAWAFYNIQIKNLPEIDVLSFVGWASVIGAPQMMIVSYFYEGNNIGLLMSAPMMPLLSLLYIAIGASLLAHGSWYYLLKIYPVSQVVPYTLLIPFFAIIMGAVIMNEYIGWQVAVGGILTIVGVAVVVLKKPEPVIGGDEA